MRLKNPTTKTLKTTGGHTGFVDRRWQRRRQEQGESVSALAAFPLLEKHEQKPPSAEQPFSECSGGEEQGGYGHLFVRYPSSVCTPDNLRPH